MNKIENKEIIKPLSVVRYEFIEDLTALINGSNLPAYIVEPILKDMYLEAKTMAKIQYEKEKEIYEESLKNK